MKRIDTSTRELDTFGTGKDGYTNGVVPTTPPTQLDASNFNHFQEELAAVIERQDKTLSAVDFHQVERVVSTSTAGTTKYAVISGLGYVAAGGTLGTLQPGEFSYNGRRYTLSAADITAIGTETDRDFGSNNITYVGIRPFLASISNDTTEVGVGLTEFPGDYCPIAVIRTDASSITQNLQQEDALAGPQIDWRSSKTSVLTPLQSIGHNGANPSFSPNRPGPYAREFMIQSRTSGPSDVVRVPMGPFGLFQDDPSLATTWPTDFWPNGTTLVFEVTVIAQHTTENNVSIVEKRMVNTFVNTGGIIVTNWTDLYTVSSAQATTDGVITNAGASDATGFYMEIDSGALTVGLILWTFHIKVIVAPSVSNAIVMGDPTNYI